MTGIVKGLLLCGVLGLSACSINVIVTGRGEVVSDPNIINCRSDAGVCRVEDYNALDLAIEDSITTFRAVPDEGHVLDRWEGDCDQTIANKCRALLGGNIYIEAIFKPIPLVVGSGDIDKIVRFVAIGDTGKANLGQFQVAAAIEKWCAEQGCDFALGMGDNFYDGTPRHIHDEQFDTKFEAPYKNLHFPFYMVLGNHDTGLHEDGDGGNQALGEVQVAYHYREDRLSDKWYMPARYYTVTYPQEDTRPLIQLFGLDSAPFVGLLDPNPVYEPEQYAREQGEWFRQQSKNSQASWKIAFAHHPYISNGRHGNASNYDSTFPGNPLLDKVSGGIYREFMDEYICGDVDLFLSGHDHNLQALKPAASCGLTEFIVSGAAASANDLARPNDNLVHFQKGDTEGFFYIKIQGNSMTVQSLAANLETGDYQLLFTKIFQRKQLIQ